MRFLAELAQRFHERMKDAREVQMQAAIRRMFAGRPHGCEQLLKQQSEHGAVSRAFGRDDRRDFVNGKGAGT